MGVKNKIVSPKEWSWKSSPGQYKSDRRTYIQCTRNFLMYPDWVHLSTLQLLYLVGRRSKIPGTDWGTKLNGTNKNCIMILKYLKVCDTAGFCLFQRKFYSEFTYYSKRFCAHVIIAGLPCNSFFLQSSMLLQIEFYYNRLRCSEFDVNLSGSQAM